MRSRNKKPLSTALAALKFSRGKIFDEI